MRGVYYRTEKDGTPLATPELRISATNNRTVYYDNQNAKEAALQNDEIKEGSIVLTGYADGESDVLMKENVDWDNKVDFTAAQLAAGYVAPADGIVCISGTSPDNSVRGFVTVNNVKISSSIAGTNVGYRESQTQILVNKGDVIRTVDGNGNAQTWILHITNIFVPFKTVGEPLTLPVNVNVVPENNKYLYTEVKTNKTWVDGRTIYRQCILVNTTSSTASATEATINASTTYTYINQIVSATLINTANKRIINPNGARIVSNTIRIYSGAYGTSVGDILILEYIK